MTTDEHAAIMQAEIGRLRAEVEDLHDALAKWEQSIAPAREAAAYAAGVEAAATWHDEERDAEEMTADGYGEVGPLIKARLHGLMAAHHFHSAVALREMKNVPADPAAPPRNDSIITRAISAFTARPCDALDVRLAAMLAAVDPVELAAALKAEGGR